MIKKTFLRVVHHNADNDGIMSATLAKLAYREKNFEILGIDKNTTVEFYGYNYETDAEWMHYLINDSITKFVFIDITPTLDFLESVKNLISEKSVEIEIFDHHHMKYDEILKTQIPVTYHYSDRWCGSKIFYDFLKEKTGNKLSKIFPTIIMLRIGSFMEYVDSYDTWKFVNENAYDEAKRNEIILVNKFLNLFIGESTFENVIKKYSWENIILIGKHLIYEADTNNIKLLENMVIGENVIVIYGSSSYQVQEAIQKCTIKRRLLIFANIKDLTSGEVTLGLRSAVPNTIDCAVEARKLNPTGGGHKEAAGCKTTLAKFFNEILKIAKNYQDSNVIETEKYRHEIIKYYKENLKIKL